MEEKELWAEYERLRDLLDRRPAMNAGLVESYTVWTSEVYMSDLGLSPNKDEVN